MTIFCLLLLLRLLLTSLLICFGLLLLFGCQGLGGSINNGLVSSLLVSLSSLVLLSDLLWRTLILLFSSHGVGCLHKGLFGSSRGRLIRNATSNLLLHSLLG